MNIDIVGFIRDNRIITAPEELDRIRNLIRYDSQLRDLLRKEIKDGNTLKEITQDGEALRKVQILLELRASKEDAPKAFMSSEQFAQSGLAEKMPVLLTNMATSSISDVVARIGKSLEQIATSVIPLL